MLLFIACDRYDDTPTITQETATNWKSVADSCTQATISSFWNTTEKRFNTSNVQDPSFHYWPQAHGLDVLVDAYIRTKDEQVKELINQWYVGVPIKNGGSFFNHYYDDMEWNALAMLRAYEQLKDEKFKTTSIAVWADIKTGWNKNAGGGIAWNKGQLDYKNTPSNAPACILAARLFRNFGDEADKEWAIQLYNWQKETLFNPANGQVYDGINRNGDGAVDDWKLTYNQGTFIGAALEMYELTKSTLYLNDAIKAANYTLANMLNTETGILQGEGTGDGGLFKGIFIRYFTLLIQHPDLPHYTRLKYVASIKVNATALYKKGFTSSGFLCGPYWGEAPSGTVGLTEQLSGAMLMEAMATLQQQQIVL